MTTFTWTPDYNPTADRKPRFKSAKFGDGYEQRSPDGLNPIAQMWGLTFSNRETSEAEAIDDFLIARGGHEYFDWTPPGGSAGRYICRQWSRVLVYYNIESITATFEQVFDQ
jgi:phage-related protein